MPRALLEVFSGRSRSPYYDVLPPSSTSSSPAIQIKQLAPLPHYANQFCWPRCTRRRLRAPLVVVGLLVTLGVAAATYVFNYPLPPLYERFHTAELALPQHDALLPLPEGRHGRYLWIANHASSEHSLHICGADEQDSLLGFLGAFLPSRRMRMGKLYARAFLERIPSVSE